MKTDSVNPSYGHLALHMMCYGFAYLYSLLSVIPHGVPRLQTWRQQSSPVLISNGLLHQGKGIEDVLKVKLNY